MARNKFTVAHVGIGPRGKDHIEGFLGNPDRFELLAICDLKEDKLKEAGENYKISKLYTNVEQMLKETKPDIFCFVTQPNIRLQFVKLAAKHDVKAIAFEKPMATSLNEAKEIVEICKKKNIKAIVSHQQKYLTSMQSLKRVLDNNEIGEIEKIFASTQGWMSQLGTHFMDYIIWANGGSKAKWVVGHLHGKGKLTDVHPSPDYILGQVEFENGIRGIIECGYLSKSYMAKDMFWVDNRLTVYGKLGYVWAETDGRWGGYINGKYITEQGDSWDIQATNYLQKPYLRELADWLDDESKVHPCNLDISYHGYEILEGLFLSALENKKMDLPIDTTDFPDLIERMKKELE